MHSSSNSRPGYAHRTRIALIREAAHRSNSAVRAQFSLAHRFGAKLTIDHAGKAEVALTVIQQVGIPHDGDRRGTLDPWRSMAAWQSEIARPRKARARSCGDSPSLTFRVTKCQFTTSAPRIWQT